MWFLLDEDKPQAEPTAPSPPSLSDEELKELELDLVRFGGEGGPDGD